METAPLVAVPATASLFPALRELWDEGAAVLPVPPGLPAAARAELLARQRPTETRRSADAIEVLRGDPVAAGVGAVLETSGTTGTPKGVCLSRAALVAAARASCERLGAEPGDRWLACVPLHHIAGFGILVRSLEFGSDPEIHERFEPERVGASDASFVSLVPTMLGRLLEAKVDLGRFKAILLGGAHIPIGLLNRAREVGANVVRSYGMTETCGGVVYDGLPLRGVDIRIEPDERIAIAGPTLMDGYRHDGSGIEGDRFITSDLGRLAEGRLEVLGRADDVIVTGGEKVAPTRVETWLLEHPDVVEACVVGVPDERWGERVVAFIVAGDDAPEQETLRAHVGARAGGVHEVPKNLFVVASLPRDERGNVDRVALREAAQA